MPRKLSRSKSVIMGKENEFTSLSPEGENIMQADSALGLTERYGSSHLSPQEMEILTTRLINSAIKQAIVQNEGNAAVNIAEVESRLREFDYAHNLEPYLFNADRSDELTRESIARNVLRRDNSATNVEISADELEKDLHSIARRRAQFELDLDDVSTDELISTTRVAGDEQRMALRSEGDMIRHGHRQREKIMSAEADYTKRVSDSQAALVEGKNLAEENYVKRRLNSEASLIERRNNAEAEHAERTLHAKAELYEKMCEAYYREADSHVKVAEARAKRLISQNAFQERVDREAANTAITKEKAEQAAVRMQSTIFKEWANNKIEINNSIAERMIEVIKGASIDELERLIDINKKL